MNPIEKFKIEVFSATFNWASRYESRNVEYLRKNKKTSQVSFFLCSLHMIDECSTVHVHTDSGLVVSGFMENLGC